MIGKRRFIAKRSGNSWAVYDLRTFSWPIARVDVGKVQQPPMSQAEATAEAERCEKASW